MYKVTENFLYGFVEFVIEYIGGVMIGEWLYAIIRGTNLVELWINQC